MIRGRKPKPTALRVLNGNPGKRALPSGEATPGRGAPPMPAFIAENDVARGEWERVVPALDKIGVLTCVDGAILEAYCICYAHWRQHEEALRAYNASNDGHVFNTSTQEGREYLQVLPQVSILLKYEAMMHSLMAELGLSPAMRTRIVGPPPGEEKESNDRLKTFFTKKREET